ncbi:hypothetical protein LTR46_000731 [Exophiala xenobiotica]|nr:hypothetical protein LTR46_000731 [Exophiala xenobiotica]
MSGPRKVPPGEQDNTRFDPDHEDSKESSGNSRPFSKFSPKSGKEPSVPKKNMAHFDRSQEEDDSGKKQDEKKRKDERKKKKA